MPANNVGILSANVIQRYLPRTGHQRRWFLINKCFNFYSNTNIGYTPNSNCLRHAPMLAPSNEQTMKNQVKNCSKQPSYDKYARTQGSCDRDSFRSLYFFFFFNPTLNPTFVYDIYRRNSEPLCLSIYADQALLYMLVFVGEMKLLN